MNEPQETRQTVGAPSELAEAQEVPSWFAQLVTAITAVPVLIGFLCGGFPLLIGICWCIAQFLLV